MSVNLHSFSLLVNRGNAYYTHNNDRSTSGLFCQLRAHAAGGERLVVDIIVVGETGGSGNAVGVIVRGGREGRGGVGLSLTKLLAEGEGEGGRGGMKCK